MLDAITKLQHLTLKLAHGFAFPRCQFLSFNINHCKKNSPTIAKVPFGCLQRTLENKKKILLIKYKT